MSIPWVPPYFGSWDELIKAVLNNPHLGEPPRKPVPYTDYMLRDPVPNAWAVAGPQPNTWSPAISFLISAISLNQVTRHMPEGQVRNDLSKSTDRAIDDFVDWCGTKVPGYHWPGPGPVPGPGPGILALVSELGIAAQSFEGPMRAEVLAVAGQIAQKAFASEVTG